MFGFKQKRESCVELKKWVRSACDVDGYRSRELDDVELVVSLYAFILWNTACVNREQAGDTSYFRAPNASARDAALEIIASLPPEVCSEIKLSHPTFDPSIEVGWGREKADHAQWKQCFTRAIILGCRHLAYSLCGATGWIRPINDPAFGIFYQQTNPDQMIRDARDWMRDAVGRKFASMLPSPD